jgi:SAM-dependent methyltransferase
MENTPWFQSWFDSKYYHQLYAHRDHQEAENFIGRMLQELNLPPSSYILDLACGKGRHAIAMQKKGYRVTGLDLSPNSIAEAIKNCPGHETEFYVHDMRIPFRIRYYDLVVNLFTSFGYFEGNSDEIKTLKAMRMALKPGGLIIMDYFNALKVIPSLPRKGELKKNNILFQWTTERQGDFVVKSIEVTEHEKNFRFIEKVRLIQPEEFHRLLMNAGLKITRTFGDYQLGDFHSENSDRFIFIAEPLS